MQETRRYVNIATVPKICRGDQYSPKEPTIYMLDAGCWTSELMCFGAISGNYLVLGRFEEAKEDVGRAGISLLLSGLNKKLRNFLKDLTPILVNPTVPQSAGNASQCKFFLNIWYQDISSYHDRVCGNKPANLVTEDDKLIVFIPDTHLGVKDQADDFYHFGKNTPEENPVFTPDTCAQMLAFLLRIANGHGATVVQTGDFYDIWEVEAENSIYFQEDQKGQVVTSCHVRSRQDRADTALASIVERWKTELENIKGNIQVYLPGNHDTELRFLNGAHPLKDKIHKGAIYNYESGQWEAEHSHRYDPLNDTTGTISVEDVLEKVAGKPITYYTARDELDSDLTGGIDITVSGATVRCINVNKLIDRADDMLGRDLMSMIELIEMPKYRVRIESLSATLFGNSRFIHNRVKEIVSAIKERLLELPLMVVHPEFHLIKWAIEATVFVLNKEEYFAEMTRSRAVILKKYNIRPVVFGSGTASQFLQPALRATEAVVSSKLGMSSTLLGDSRNHDTSLTAQILNINFAATRLNAMREIARRLQEANPSYVFYNPVPWRNRELDENDKSIPCSDSPGENHFSIPFENSSNASTGKKPTVPSPLPEPPIQLPLRVLIHSHTHSPVIIGLHLRHVSAVCSGGEYEKDDLEPVKAESDTLPSGLPWPHIHRQRMKDIVHPIPQNN